MIQRPAFIDSTAQIHKDAVIDTHAIIGPNVTIGAGSHVHSFAVVYANTKMGENNIVHSGAVLGGDPQDLCFSAQKDETWLIIGDNNTFREQVTINRGSAKAQSHTVIGNHNYFMTCSHVGHDCEIGDYNTLVNCAALAGHVIVGNYVQASAYCAIHQFCQVGDYAFVTHASQCVKDILPFVMVTTDTKPRVNGLNTIGLKRAGISSQDIRQLKRAYQVLFRQGLLLNDAVKALKAMVSECHLIQKWLDAIEQSERGFIR